MGGLVLRSNEEEDNRNWKEERVGSQEDKRITKRNRKTISGVERRGGWVLMSNKEEDKSNKKE